MKCIKPQITVLLACLAVFQMSIASDIQTWSTTAANNNSAPPNGWPENMSYSQVNDSARENMAAVARLYADMNGTLTTTGATNAYTLAPNRSVTAYAEGLGFVFQANHTNTGAATLNVSSLGAKDLRDPEGAAITSGYIQANHYYSVRFQGTYFIVVDLDGRSFVGNSTAIDLTDTNNAINLGANAPDTNPHLALSLNQLQAKADASTTATLNIQPLGGDVNIGPQTGSGGVRIYVDGARILEAEGPGLLGLYGNTNDDADNRLLIFRQANGTTRGRLGYASSGTFEMRNFVQGANVVLAGVATGGANHQILQGDPDGDLFGYRAGSVAWQTRDDGLSIRGRTGSGSTQDTFLELEEADGTNRARFGFVLSENLQIGSFNHGARILIQGEDNAGILRTGVNFDPDTNVALGYAGEETAKTAAPSDGGLLANNTKTGTGEERVLTESDLPPEASLSIAGIVQLNNTTTSSSTTLAATANAVKTVNDQVSTNTSNIATNTSNIAANTSAIAGKAAAGLHVESSTQGEFRDPTTGYTIKWGRGTTGGVGLDLTVDFTSLGLTDFKNANYSISILGYNAFDTNPWLKSQSSTGFTIGQNASGAQLQWIAVGFYL